MAVADVSQMIAAEEALAPGFVVETLVEAAPVTLRVTKEALARLASQDLPAIDDLVRLTYGSADFAEGVRAFLAQRQPVSPCSGPARRPDLPGAGGGRLARWVEAGRVLTFAAVEVDQIICPIPLARRNGKERPSRITTRSRFAL
jgi:hypothetical protein